MTPAPVFRQEDAGGRRGTEEVEIKAGRTYVFSQGKTIPKAFGFEAATQI
jgi:hypothetical protein